MELDQNEVDKLLNSKRINEAIPEKSSIASNLDPLRTFRSFIDEHRKALGDHFHLLKEKEIQLIKLHQQTVQKIKKTKKVCLDSIRFFKERMKDYDAMVAFALKSLKSGRLLNLPPFGSPTLRKLDLIST
jgi:hypothetical protein